MNHRFATPSRRRLLGLGAASLAALTPLARAQTGQPLKIMVGFAAGGSADQTARLLADQLRVQLKRPVIVDNRAGAGGRIMVEGVKAAKPDGDTLMFVPHGAMTLFPHIYRSLRYDPVADRRHGLAREGVRDEGQHRLQRPGLPGPRRQEALRAEAAAHPGARDQRQQGDPAPAQKGAALPAAPQRAHPCLARAHASSLRLSTPLHRSASATRTTSV